MYIIPFNPSHVLKGFPPFINEDTSLRGWGQLAECYAISNSSNGNQSLGWLSPKPMILLHDAEYFLLICSLVWKEEGKEIALW